MPLLISSIVLLVQSCTHAEHLLKSTNNPWPRLISGLLHARVAGWNNATVDWSIDVSEDVDLDEDDDPTDT